jgi:subtilisin family serine protease
MLISMMKYSYMILDTISTMFEKSIKFSALLVTILLASCGGGGGGSTTTVSTTSEDVVTWTNGIYDPWYLTSENTTTDEPLCTVDVYSRDVWWEKNINGNPTGIKGGLIRTETQERNEECTTPIQEPEPIVNPEPTIVSTIDTDSITTDSSTGSSETTTSSIIENRTSTDDNGSTVVKTYTIYTDVTTTPITTTTTLTTTRAYTYSDGSTTSEVIDISSSNSVNNVVTTATREVLTNTVITPNVVSTSDDEATTSSAVDSNPVVSTAYVDEVRTSTDISGNTVLSTYRIYTDTSTIMTTTVTTTITTRITTWSDGSTTSEVIGTSDSSATNDTVTTTTREEIISTSTTANVLSTSDNDSTTTSESTGTTAVTTTSTTEDRTSTDADGSTVTNTYTIYTDTSITPVTTTTIVTTTHTTTWSDGSTTSEVINVGSSDSISNTVTTATREELTNTVVTPNIVSTSTVYKNERTTSTESELISELYGTNSDTITVGTGANGAPIQQAVTLYYYSWHRRVQSTTLKDEYTRTTYTDGSVVDTLVTVDVETTAPPVKTYLLDPWGGQKTTTQRVPVGETFIGNPVAPDSSSGSSGVYTYAQRSANHSANNYNTGTYYNSDYLGTPTNVASNNPTNFETTEAENGAVLVTYASHAYARGWTGKGSTTLIMDTGIDQDHPEFTGKVKYLWDAGYDTPYEDENGHGSHVAGIVSANKDEVGIHGIAYDANLAIAKIGEANGISLSGAKQALNWAKQYDDIVVANLSANTNYSSLYKSSMTDQGEGVFTNNHAVYGGSNYYNLEEPTTWSDVLPSELVLVVSAGNTDAGYVQNPATMATAVDTNGNLELDGRMLIAGNWNTSTQTIDGAKSGHVCKDYTTQCNDTYKTSDFYILAPGTNINSVKNGGGYTRMSGTSQAAPVVTGGVAIVHQLWPYMKGSNIAQLLLQTANKDLSNYSVTTHGQGLLDLDKATQPVGELGISLTGRTGTTANISGGVSISGMDDSVIASLSSVSVIDDFDRDFKVDLTSMIKQNANLMPLQSAYKKGDSWSARLLNLDVKSLDDFSIGLESKEHFLIGYNKSIAGTSLELNLNYSKNKTNPWVDVSGIWGDVDSTSTIDSNLTWTNDNFWVQGGAMVINTDLTTGLVSDIDNLYSVYTTAGWDEDNWRIYAGTKPKLVKGDVEFHLPSNVDENGVMHYSKHKTQVKNETTSFAGGSWQYDMNDYLLIIMDGVVDSGNEYHTSITINKQF